MSTSLRKDKTHIKLTKSQVETEEHGNQPSSTSLTSEDPVSNAHSSAENDTDKSGAATSGAGPVRAMRRSDSFDYELGAVIQRDAQGVAYRARKPGSADRLALKVFTATVTEQQAIENFQRAAETASTWSHACLARVFDYGFSDSGKPFVVTEELQGRNLEEILSKEKRLTRERALRSFIQICDALAYVSWTKDSVGDLCSQNIFITRDENGSDSVKVLNVGLHVEPHYEVDGLPPSGARANYASPERCSGMPVDERAAIYSVGCLLYEAVTGRLPFTGKNEFEIIQKQLSANPAPLFPKERKRDKHLEGVILKCLAKRPEERFQTFNELSGELDAVLNTLPQVAASRWIGRHQFLKAIFCLGDCLILAVALGVTTVAVTHKVAQHNAGLNDLRATIARAENSSWKSSLESSSTRDAFSVTKKSRQESVAPALWHEAITKAQALHQPRAVLADLHVRKAESFDPEKDKIGAELEYKKAVAIYEKEGLNFEAQQVHNALSAKSLKLSARETGEPLYQHLTPDHIDRFKISVEQTVRLLRDSGSEDWQLCGLLAGMRIQQKEYKPAEWLLKDTLNSMPPDEQPYILQWQLADCLKRAGKLSESALWYNKAGRYDIPSSFVPGDDLKLISASYIDVLEQLGKKDEAKAIRRTSTRAYSPAEDATTIDVPSSSAETRPNRQYYVQFMPPTQGETYDAFSGD